MYGAEQQNFQNSGIAMNGCGYQIQGDRVIITIAQIISDRNADNLSGTLQVELCALQQNSEQLHEYSMATTTIGELMGQCQLTDCRYDLIFAEPPAGVWQFRLQLKEWDGQGYQMCDSAYFEVPYETDLSQPIQAQPAATIDDSTEITPNPTSEASATVSALAQATDSADLTDKACHDVSTSPSVTEAPKDKTSVKKNSKTGCDDSSLVNQAKKAQLKRLKGVHQKVLAKVIKERPFQNRQALLNIKGMGPKVLERILQQLREHKNGE